MCLEGKIHHCVSTVSFVVQFFSYGLPLLASIKIKGIHISAILFVEQVEFGWNYFARILVVVCLQLKYALSLRQKGKRENYQQCVLLILRAWLRIWLKIVFFSLLWDLEKGACLHLNKWIKGYPKQIWLAGFWEVPQPKWRKHEDRLVHWNKHFSPLTC